MTVQDTIPLGTYIPLLIGVMLASGILGGLANYSALERRTQASKRITWGGYVLLGVAAAFAVPLFLNMISSNLLDAGRTAPLNLFVLCGFCVIAALFSRSFLENLYNKILQQVQDVEAKVERIEEVASEPESSDDEIATAKQKESSLPENNLKVLSALNGSKYAYRSLSGLARQAQLTKQETQHVLNDLLAKGFVGQTMGKNNRTLWFLTERGKTYPASSS
jgi:hypothetical protein